MTVTTEGSVGFAGGIIFTDVLISVMGGAGVGLVDVALVVRSSINF